MGRLRDHPGPAMPASMPCARLDTHPPPDQLGYWAPLRPGADPRAPAVTIVAAATTPGLGRALRLDALKGLFRRPMASRTALPGFPSVALRMICSCSAHDCA